MGRELENAKMCYVGFQDCRLAVNRQPSVMGRAPISSIVWGDEMERGSPEPSSSLLLKQLSIIRRFSSSKRSARVRPADDIVGFTHGASAVELGSGITEWRGRFKVWKESA